MAGVVCQEWPTVFVGAGLQGVQARNGGVPEAPTLIEQSRN